jgi:hypothetical protein
MVVKVDGQRIMLFFTGAQHAGENLEDLLRDRPTDLDPAILMSDRLGWNTSGDIEVVDTRCNAHARRKFVGQIGNFPDECRFVLESFQRIYAVDARAREGKLSAEARLDLHRSESKPALDALWTWMEEQRQGKCIEANSGLGKALEHMRSLWPMLTRFTEIAGVPLDNKICERALKLAIRHRRNTHSDRPCICSVLFRSASTGTRSEGQQRSRSPLRPRRSVPLAWQRKGGRASQPCHAAARTVTF